MINIEKNIIEVNLRSLDGQVQNFSDEIKTIEKDKIVSEKIKSAKGEEIYYQYFLDAKAKSVIKLQFRKESGIDMAIFKLNQKRKSFCEEVKGDWDKEKIDEAKLEKEEIQILKAEEKLKAEENKIIVCQGNDHKLWTNCKGIFLAESGHKYEGIFSNGKILKGVSYYPGGAKYVGEFLDFKPHGYGTFVWVNGDKYFGEWNLGKSHGNGTRTWSDGRKYMGMFKNDKLHGKGTLFYPDDKKYVGEFIDGKRHGEGTFFYPDGTAYVGKFVAGKEQGLGECISADGKAIKCENRKDAQSKYVMGPDMKNISLTARKWVRISQYETTSGKGKKIMDKLKSDFDAKASELCSAEGNFKILEKKIEVLDVDDTPAYGLETKLQLGINGVVQCTKES